MADNSNEAGPSNIEASTSTAAAPSPPQTTCASCHKPETSPDPIDNPTLKPCISCKSVVYCSRECKKQDLKKHKKLCPELAQKYFQTHDVKMATGAGAGRKVPEGRERGLQKWHFDT